MTKYLNTKPGSVEEVVANMNKNLRQDGAYQDMFKKELEKAGKGIGSMSPKEKKAFFNKIDSKYKAKDEGFASDAQRKAAFASGYKEKGKKEDLGKEDEKSVKDVIKGLKKATQLHSKQAASLSKAMKNEADQHGDEINKKKMDTRDDKSKGEKEIKKLADTGSKLSKVDTEPKADYKN